MGEESSVDEQSGGGAEVPVAETAAAAPPKKKRTVKKAAAKLSTLADQLTRILSQQTILQRLMLLRQSSPKHKRQKQNHQLLHLTSKKCLAKVNRP